MSRTVRILPVIIAFALVAAFPSWAAEKPNGGWDPMWSPDGKTIVFSSGSPHSIPNVWTCRADGSQMRRLTSAGGHNPTWFPDGKSILFGTIRSGKSISMSIAADGAPGSEETVEFLPAGAVDPVWSPDGSLIAFGLLSADGKARDLCFVRASGGSWSRLTTKFWIRDWTWSRDGGSLAFVVGRAIGTSLWTVTLKDKELSMLFKGYCSAPAYSPDGKTLAIAVPDVRSANKINLIDVNARKATPINVETFDGRKIIWSPEGSKLYFSSAWKSEPAIWCVGSDGKKLTRLTAKGLEASSPALSSDGRNIAFQAVNPGSYSQEIYVGSVSGAKPLKLTASSASYWSPVWSPDGKKLLVQTDTHHKTEIVAVPAAGGTGKVVASDIEPGHVGLHAWLPNSMKLVVSNAGKLMVVDTGIAYNSKTAQKPFAAVKGGAESPEVKNGRIYYTEWQGKDARIASVKLDGTDPVALTTKPKAEAKAETEKTAAEEDKTGEAHAGLGNIGPHPDTKPADETPAVVDMSPVVSPDGKTVAFIRGGQVFSIETDGKNQRQLTQLKSEPGEKRELLSLAWAPSGEWILIHAITAGKESLSSEFWKAELTPGSERLIYSETAGSEYGQYYQDCANPPEFTPDGKAIVFTSVAGPEPGIMMVNSDGSNPKTAVPAPSTFAAMDPAGLKLAYVALSNNIEKVYILDLKSGKSSLALGKK